MRETTYRIVRATRHDAGAISPLFEAYRSFFAGAAAADGRRFLEERLAGEESVVFAAWQGDDAVGFVQLYPLWSSWYCRRIWFLSDLYVEESVRRHGIGAGLVRRVIAFAKESDASSIMVELPRREPHLAAFYANLGFGVDEVFELARFRLA
jgi:GNAT superfamily N-acetyltransferase